MHELESIIITRTVRIQIFVSTACELHKYIYLTFSLHESCKNRWINLRDLFFKFHIHRVCRHDVKCTDDIHIHSSLRMKHDGCRGQDVNDAILKGCGGGNHRE